MGIIASIIGGIEFTAHGNAISRRSEFLAFLIGLVIMAVGSLVTYLGALGIYGFGQLVQDTSYIKDRIDESVREQKAEKISASNNAGKPAEQPKSSSKSTVTGSIEMREWYQ